MNFTEEQLKRYSRHIILQDVGGKGQKKLLESRVLLIGAGGLGCPTGYYLAAAGVGNIGIVDDDRVELSNLQRQIMHAEEDIGRLKAESAKDTINNLNSDINVKIYLERISADNILKIIKDYDIIIDGSDNFPTRYLVNDVCVMNDKINIHGSVSGFDGQATVFKPGEGPCYRCMCPEPPPTGFAPSCQEGGVLGVLPGLIGIIQATETIKQILNIKKEDTLIGRRLCYNATKMSFKEYSIPKDPNCQMCGDNPTITELKEYEQICEI